MPTVFPTRLPIRPAPKPEEALTSWVTRLALAYGLSTRTFCKLHLGAHARCDLDHPHGNRIFPRLEQFTGVKARDLRANHALIGFRGRLYGEEWSSAADPWLFLNYRWSLSNWYFQVCPHCLEEDPTHYKRTWRLSLFCICPIHRCFLLHGCPACQQPINTLKFEPLYGDEFRRCHSCGFNFADVTPLRASDGDCRLTQSNLDLLKFRTNELLVRLGTDSTSYFFVFRLLCDCMVQKLPKLVKWKKLVADTLCVRQLPDYSSCWQSNSFDCLYYAGDRQVIVRAASRLLADWPDTFLDVATAAHTSPGDFVRRWQYYNVPAWFENTVRRHLVYRTRRRSTP